MVGPGLALAPRVRCLRCWATSGCQVLFVGCSHNLATRGLNWEQETPPRWDWGDHDVTAFLPLAATGCPREWAPKPTPVYPSACDGMFTA